LVLSMGFVMGVVMGMDGGIADGHGRQSWQTGAANQHFLVGIGGGPGRPPTSRWLLLQCPEQQESSG